MRRIAACIGAMFSLATPAMAQPSRTAPAAVVPEPYRFPFATRDEWLAFVAGTPGGVAAADAYRRLYPDADYVRLKATTTG